MDITKDLRLKIIGLGKVGISIAQDLAQSGFSVQGMDVDRGNIDRGLKKVGLNLDTQVKKGKINPEEKNGILSRIALSTDLGCISDGDVVIEAVFEDMDT